MGNTFPTEKGSTMTKTTDLSTIETHEDIERIVRTARLEQGRYLRALISGFFGRLFGHAAADDHHTAGPGGLPAAG